MKHNRLRLILIIEAIICIIFAFSMESLEYSFISIMAFPFEQIGAGLRMLSLSGASSNIAAISIYIAFCIIPIIYLIIRRRKNKAHIEDGLLVLISLILFVVIYMMINPADIARHFGAVEMISANKAFIGAVVYSVIAGYIIIRVLRKFLQCGTDVILRYLKILLGVVCVALIYGIFGSGLIGLQDSFKLLAAGNTGAGGELFLSYVFLVIQYLVAILPYALNIVIIFLGFGLADALEKDLYSEEVTISAQRISKVCRTAVLVIMLSQIVVNVFQLALGSLIRASHYTLNIPLLSVVFMLVIMLFAKYFEQAKALKSDNDSII